MCAGRKNFSELRCCFARPYKRLVEEYIVQTVGFEKIYFLRFLGRAANAERNEDGHARFFFIGNIAFALGSVPPQSNLAVFVLSPFSAPFALDCE